MAKIGKRMKAALEKINIEREYSLEEACSLLVEVSKVKFDETVDVAVNLGVDPRKADQNVRGSVALPHGLGKNIRVLVFAKGDKAQEAERAGADFIGAEDLVEKIKGGFQEFDSVVATPDLMVQVGKVGKILGPRGLMPSPKIGTVTFDVESTVRSIKAGRGEYRVEKTGIVHAPVGKVSFGGQKLAENVTAMMQALHKAKPSTSKGVYFKKATVSSTMGPGLKIDLAPFRGM